MSKITFTIGLIIRTLLQLGVKLKWGLLNLDILKRLKLVKTTIIAEPTWNWTRGPQ